MQGPSGHRGWIGATTVLTFGLALTWGLLRFGAAETAVLYRLFLFLLVPALLALLMVDRRSQADWRTVTLALFGVGLLGQVVLQPTLEAKGYLHVTVGWIALWLAFSQSYGRRRYARFLVAMLVLLGVFEAFYGLAQSITGFDHIGDYFREQGRIASGTLINRNHYAALLNLVLPLALGLLFANQALKRSERASRSESLAKTWVVLLGCSLMGVAVLMSQSRGGTITLLTTLLFMALLLSLARRRVSRRGVSGVAAALLLFLVAGMGAAFGLEALLERFGRLDENLSRVGVYRGTLEMIGEEWILGVGPGMYRWRFPLYQTVDLDRLYDHAHNDYLETASEWGVVLAVAAWGLVLWRFYRSSVLALAGGDPWRQGMAMGCAGALFSILTHSLVDFSLQIPSILMVFGCVLGLSWVLEFSGPSLGEEGLVPSLGWGPSLLVRALLAIALIAAGWQTFQRSRALAAARPERGVAGLERAVTFDPEAPEPHFLLAMAYRDMPGAGDLTASAAQLEKAVRLNPYSTRYWREYARTLELQGDDDQAEALYRVAVSLTPQDAVGRWQLANLLLRRDDLDGAVEEIAAAVQLEPRLAEPAVALVMKSGVETARVEAFLPEDRSTLISLLRSRITTLQQPASGSATPDSLVDSLWSRLLDSAEPPSVAEGRVYVDYLMRTGRSVEAREAWLDLMGVSGYVDPAFESGSSRVWNGEFELELAGRPFGWQVVRSEKVVVQRVPKEGMEGSAALQVEFLGKENLDFTHVGQQLLLEPGERYRLRLALHTAELTTDQGVSVEVVSRDPRTLLVATDPVSGTSGWLEFEVLFTMPEGSGQAEIRLRRRISQQIDSRIRGKVWLDSVGIEKVTP